MNKDEARSVLRTVLERYRSFTYAELVGSIGEPQTQHTTSDSGATYQVEIEILWDDAPGGNVRVMGSVDDGGWRAFLPLSESFIVAPDGSSVGE